MGKTERISARASKATREKLMRLLERYGSQSEVLAVAIDRLYRQEFSEAVRSRATASAENEGQP